MRCRANTGQPIKYLPVFAHKRRLPDTGRLPLDSIQRVVLGWSHEDESWHLGLLLGPELAEARGVFSSESRAFVFIGILGGFTTFSSFGNETLNLARGGEFWSALSNVGLNVVIGLFAVWLGRTVAYLIWK